MTNPLTKQIILVRTDRNDFDKDHAACLCAKVSLDSVLRLMRMVLVINSEDSAGPYPPDYLEVRGEFAEHSPIHLWLTGDRKQELIFVGSEEEFWRIYFEAKNYKYEILTSMAGNSVCAIGPAFESDLTRILRP